MKNLIAIVLLGVILCCAPGAAFEKKTTLFTNATFYLTPDKTVRNLLVKNGRVAGFNVKKDQYRHAAVVDLKGAFVYPGFHDSHCHLLEAGLGLSGVNLLGCHNARQIAQRIASAASEIPAEEPLIGTGFHLVDYDDWNLKDLALIDKAAGKHLLIAVDNLGHNCIVNSAVLKKYQIKADSVVGPAGKIVTQDGKPTGMLKESAMILAGEPMMRLFPNRTISQGVQKIMQMWASFGYTQFNDMMGSPMGAMMRPGIFKRLERQGQLPLRVNYSYTIFSLKDIPKALLYRWQDSDMVRFTGLKIFVDGALGAGQAWTSWKNLQNNNGVYYVYGNDDALGPEYNLNRIVAKADALQLNVHYHAQGDQAIETVIKALEDLKAQKGKLNSTHTLIHLGFPRKDQIERLKDLGGKVNVTMQPGLWEVEKTERYYGEYAKDVYPVKKLQQSGISTGISTDFSVSPLSIAPPLTIMQIASQPQKYGFPPSLALTPKDIVRGFTLGSSATIPKADTGSLETGKWADMTVFDRNPYTAKPADLAKIKVLSTWVGGKKMYDRQEAEKAGKTKTDGK